MAFGDRALLERILGYRDDFEKQSGRHDGGTPLGEA